MADKNIIDAMWDDSPIDVSTEVNFIWSIANKLRGPYRSDKYKDVIIPMVFMTYANVVFSYGTAAPKHIGAYVKSMKDALR